MKIVFVSNILNHHQTFLCEALKNRCDNFCFVETERVETLGYQRKVDKPYVLRYYNEDEKTCAEKEIMDADAVIFGSCPNHLIEMRMRENKLSFLFSERFFKKGIWRRFIPKTRKKIKNRIVQYKGKNMYVLCASAYLPFDLSLLNFPVDKCLRWGYFPETKTCDENTLFVGKKENSILWCGRFLSWKRPKLAVQIARRLKQNGYNFTLTMVGDGVERSKIETLLKKWGLTDNVVLVGAKTPQEVRAYMEQSQIFLFTSNRYEGWGAVLNEAMNSGCATVASAWAGATPFLIQDGKNGREFKNEKQAYRMVKQLLDNKNVSKLLGQKAYQTIVEQWNADEAATRLIAFTQNALNGKVKVYDNDVCSLVKIVKG